MAVYRRLCFAIFLMSLVATGLSAKGDEKLEPPLVAFEEEGKWGFLSATGKVVIGPKFDAAGDFGEGFASVWSGKRLLLINSAGKEQIQFPEGTQWIRGVSQGRIWLANTEWRGWHRA